MKKRESARESCRVRKRERRSHLVAAKWAGSLLKDEQLVIIRVEKLFPSADAGGAGVQTRQNGTRVSRANKQ